MSILQQPTPKTITYTHKNGLKEVFVVHEELGHGGLATVYRVTHQRSNKSYAMKIISKQFLRSKGEFALKKLKDEMKIQKKLNHPNILQSRIAFSDDLNYYIVLEYCPGKSIREYIKKSEKGYLSEPETKKILRDVIRGLIYLHHHNIIHRDLKLENFIIDSYGKVKIADFGLATFFKEDEEKQSLICGTINYLSPEIVQMEGGGFESDIWAIGVATFIMLTGHPPFAAANKDLVFEKIKQCDYNFPSRIFISPEAKKFISSILRKNPYKRPKADELMSHPFLAKMDKEFVELYHPDTSSQKVPTPIENQSFQKVPLPTETQPIQKLLPRPPRTNSSLNSENIELNNIVRLIEAKGGKVSRSLRILRAKKLGIKTLETEEEEGKLQRSNIKLAKHRSHI